MLGVAAMNILDKIKLAFSHRKPPHLTLVSNQLAAHEFHDIEKFLGKSWEDITCDQLEKHFELMNWLTPDGFCYYLPGIISASISENRPEIIAVGSLVGMLDRSPDTSLWDDFFSARWPLLTVEECAVLQEWILWLSSWQGSIFEESTLLRAFETLELLRARPT